MPKRQPDDSKLAKPSVSTESGPLFWQEPPAIYQATIGNLDKSVRELFAAGAVVSVTDPGLPAASLTLQLTVV